MGMLTGERQMWFFDIPWIVWPVLVLVGLVVDAIERRDFYKALRPPRV